MAGSTFTPEEMKRKLVEWRAEVEACEAEQVGEAFYQLLAIAEELHDRAFPHNPITRGNEPCSR